MTLTYVDTGVFIAIARGSEAAARRAMEILEDPDRQFVSGIFLKLELLPLAHYNRQADQVRSYEKFFARCVTLVEGSAEICEVALNEAVRHGLDAIDALHIVSAARGGAVEFVTTEKPTSTIHRTALVPVVTIHGS